MEPLTKEKQDILDEWIRHSFIPTEKINYKYDTSYFREVFERAYAKGFYIDNRSMNEALLCHGYCTDAKDLDRYCEFNISPKSPVIDIYRHVNDLYHKGEKYNLFGENIKAL